MFANKTVIITGGANGIGYACAVEFLKEGANVVLADLSVPAGLKSEKELSYKYENRCLFVHTDTGEENSIKQMVSKTTEKFGSISTLVNGAASFIMKGIDASATDWSKICSVNITGYALCAKYCLPSMIDSGEGIIVNICSISAIIAQPGFVTYSATKGAIASMTRCMALDLAKHNIRVNAISPGTVWTKSNEKFHREVMHMDRSEADKHPEIGGAHVLHRVADPKEIADVVVFLASKKSSFITGENVVVDGGYTVF